MDMADNRESSFKELPTRELKLKRHKSRRDSPTIPPIRLGLKSNASSLNNETDMEKCLSDRSVSSSPDSQVLSPVFISSPHKAACESTSSSSSPLTNDSYHAFSFNPSTYIENEDSDQPLDMSRKRTEITAISTIDSSSSQQQQQQLRPSVITCASALLKTQCNLSDVPHIKCTIKVNFDSNCNDIDDNNYINNHQLSKSNNGELEITDIGSQHEIASGFSDPVIDEHFRRSLGKDYQNIFSKTSSNNVSITVDDHFAKALGETWHQLQQTKVSSNQVSTHASSALQNQTQQQFLQSAPEILS